MSSLNLSFEQDATSKEVHGRYSDWKAFEVLQRYLEPDRNLSVEQATALIHDMLPTETEKIHLAGQPGMFATLVLEVAQQIPYSHPSQVRLVRLLQRLAISSKLNQLTTFEGYTFYASMESFKIALRGYHFPQFDASSAEETSSYVNIIALMARLTACWVINGTTYAIWTMKESLEEDVEDDYYSGCISAAAMWILCAGQTLFVEIVQSPRKIEADEEHNSFRPGPLFTGPTFGLERWEFWQRAFAAALEKQAASDECKRLARKATDLMGAIAQDMSW